MYVSIDFVITYMYGTFHKQRENMTNLEYCFKFPAIRGTQAGRPCYIAMCPMRTIPTLMQFNEEVVPPELRAQRNLNITRIPPIVDYLNENPNDYVLSSLTASIDSTVEFTPLEEVGAAQNMGILNIPMDATILINDGQHRRAAIEAAIKENPELAHDNISVLFFIDMGLARSQQMFADLNKHAVRPSPSISTLYDVRDAVSELGRYAQENVHVFSRLTELEKSSLSPRSFKLFTLSSIKNASKALLRKPKPEKFTKEEKDLVVRYWNEVAANMPDWQAALSKKVNTSELRLNYVHAHAVFLQAMGQVGSELLNKKESEWKEALKKLKSIDWSRDNKAWRNRALSHGKISRTRTSVMLTGNYIKKQLNLPLSLHETEIEEQLFNG